jgi:hypothetical protein
LLISDLHIWPCCNPTLLQAFDAGPCLARIKKLFVSAAPASVVSLDIFAEPAMPLPLPPCLALATGLELLDLSACRGGLLALEAEDVDLLHALPCLKTLELLEAAGAEAAHQQDVLDYLVEESEETGVSVVVA